MLDVHQKLLRALVAAQVAVLEHADEQLDGEAKAKKALTQCLAEAQRLAKKLED